MTDSDSGPEGMLEGSCSRCGRRGVVTRNERASAKDPKDPEKENETSASLCGRCAPLVARDPFVACFINNPPRTCERGTRGCGVRHERGDQPRHCADARTDCNVAYDEPCWCPCEPCAQATALAIRVRTDVTCRRLELLFETAKARAEALLGRETSAPETPSTDNHPTPTPRFVKGDRVVLPRYMGFRTRPGQLATVTAATIVRPPGRPPWCSIAISTGDDDVHVDDRYVALWPKDDPPPAWLPGSEEPDYVQPLTRWLRDVLDSSTSTTAPAGLWCSARQWSPSLLGREVIRHPPNNSTTSFSSSASGTANRLERFSSSGRTFRYDASSRRQAMSLTSHRSDVGDYVLLALWDNLRLAVQAGDLGTQETMLKRFVAVANNAPREGER